MTNVRAVWPGHAWSCGVVLMATMLLAGCTATNPLYRPAERLYTAGPEPGYGAYLAGAREHLNKYAVAVDGFERERQIEWRMPFERAPAAHCSGEDTTGLLLIHGLADTPFIFRDLAERLAERCVRVRAILLPGHGTRPGDLVTAESDLWFDAARTHARGLAKEVDRLYVGGHSLGGAIATVLALEDPSVEGLVAFAPAWELDGLNDVLWLGTLAEPFIDFIEREPEPNPVKYESLAVNTGDEMGEVLGRVRSALEARESIGDLPLLLVATEADSVIDLDYLQRGFREKFTHPASHMLLYRDTREPAPAWWQSRRMSERMAWLPEHRIVEMSHQSLPVGAGNPLYGIDGLIRHCLEPNGASREECLARDPASVRYAAYRGEDERSERYLTSRLTWNPHFDDLVNRVARLLAADRARSTESSPE